MIVCPVCVHENIDGTIFCDNCGAQLVGGDNVTTQTIQASSSELKLPDDFKKPVSPPKQFDTWASLHLLESGHILPLSDRLEFTIGRVSNDQPIMPDVDLTPYNAYSNGVSRIHVVLKREGERVFIRDLGSSNGTYVNGERLKENSDHTLHHGDILSLGKLKIQILLRNS